MPREQREIYPTTPVEIEKNNPGAFDYLEVELPRRKSPTELPPPLPIPPFDKEKVRGFDGADLDVVSEKLRDWKVWQEALARCKEIGDESEAVEAGVRGMKHVEEIEIRGRGNGKGNGVGWGRRELRMRVDFDMDRDCSLRC